MNDLNKNTVKAAIWVGVGCIAIIICCVFAAASGIFGLLRLVDTPKDVVVNVKAPVQVHVGDEILIEITVENRSSQSYDIKSIDVGLNYLEGVAISFSEPAFVSTNQVDVLGEAFQTYYFDQTLSPGDTLKIILAGQAVSIGDYSGKLDVCVRTDASCFNNILRTVVGE